MQRVLRAELLHGHLRVYGPRSTQSSDRCAGAMVCRVELERWKVRRTGDNPWCEAREQDDMIQ